MSADSGPAKAYRNGRPPSDRAYVVRNQLWAYAVHSRGGVSWDALDDHFLELEDKKDPPRPRRFWSVARRGINPASRNPLAKSPFDHWGDQFGLDSVSPYEDLVALVDADSNYAGLGDIYRSMLWVLLTRPALLSIDRKWIANELMVGLELFHCPPELAVEGQREFPDEPAFRPLVDVASSLEAVLEHPTLDHVAFLACEFRTEMDALNLQAADAYLHSVRSTLVRVIETFDVPADILHDLQFLIEQRILRNNWQPLDEGKFKVRRKRSLSSSESKYQERLVQNLIGVDEQVPSLSPEHTHPNFPIVRLTPALDSFMARAGQRRSDKYWRAPS